MDSKLTPQPGINRNKMLVIIFLCTLMCIFADHTIYMTWQLAMMFMLYNVHERFPRCGHSVGVLGTSREDSGPDLVHTVSGCFL